ncbi:maltose alpha-D-glucosyltransferase [Pseudoroseicyclus sp. H15]
MSLDEQNAPQDGIVAADWYKDAIIYQLHVKAYQDSNNDGMGDFAGLMSRLDHVQELGATAVWLLPFYPSPLRDDGYDIAEFKEVNPSYGTMEDFEGFVAEAHRRGLKVITELVINHTSDQHEWFQRARHAPKGSPERDFYVWSDDPTKWMDKTRVIFNDTHDSNWTWDPVAEQFYWHRFFDHQPDLNFDNPKVMEAVLDVMHFWLDKGVDGLRLDAIPYLVERDGTNNENLPETHDILKAIRADLDKHYDDKMLLAEANQWPEDTRPYFGEGDECHMGFHFPLMPRMYMSVAQEDRHPITDIIRQTPDIPDNCQWAIFLRNHDELTLEMVTDKERDYLWETYAADKRARINMGIRRRLAPLLQNDRRKIELLNSMLMSMPGTPILYYGDEIGMGDNIYLGDRDGVRTPMQWSPDRNAGFSRADPQRLYLPTIQDAIYGFEARNVESQAQDPSSYLNWMRRMVAVRQNHDVFGRGEMRLLYPKNRKVLAYIREYEDKAVLCVANLSRQAQAVEIDLGAYAGRVPIELTGHSAFPPIGALPYLVTLPAYGFYWFELADEAEAPSWRTAPQEILPEFLTLTTSRDGRVSSALTGREGRMLQSDVLPSYLPIQRWFAAKDKTIKSTKIAPLADLEDGRAALALLDVDLDDETQQYLLPLAALWGEDNVSFGSPTLGYTLSKLRRGPSVGGLIDGTADVPAMTGLFEALRKGGELPAEGGSVLLDRVDAMDSIEDAGEARLLNVEQSNATMAFSDKAILKLYRRLRPGVQPDIEVSRFLTGPGGFDGTPAFLGELAFQPKDGERVSLGAAFAFVRNQGDAWAAVTDGLERLVAESSIDDGSPDPYLPGLDLAPLIGTRTAQMHVALSKGTEPDFAPEPMTPERLAAFSDEVIAELDDVLASLAATTDLADETAELAARVQAGGAALKKRVASLKEMTPSGALTRIHGDYHLGQVLVAQNDVMIIDFEGEPRRSVAERRAKASPLRDLAGMVHSLDYAAFSARKWTRQAAGDEDEAAAKIEDWHARASAELHEAYAAAITESSAHPDNPAFAAAMLDALYIQKAAYQVGYELAMRPTWLDIGLAALATRLEQEGNS